MAKMGDSNTSNADLVVPLWLDGKELETGQTFDVVSPTTAKTCHWAAAATEENAEAAIQSCRRAFSTWSQAKPTTRRDIFLRAASHFERRKAELWDILHLETGVDRPFFEATFAGAVDMCKDIAGRVSCMNGKAPIVDEAGSSALVFRVPYGVVIGIAPWYVSLDPLPRCSLTI